MRAMWKGAISFGLVTIPVKLYTATETKDLKFNFLHDVCKTPIRYEKVCPACGREVTNDEIVRGYEYEKGRYVVIKEEDLENLPLDTIRSIQIVDFVNLAEIDPIYFMKSYFLAPGDLGLKAYRLLYRAMDESGKIAIAKVALRAKESLAAIRVYQDSLMMSTMYYPEEVRSAEHLPELAGEVKLHDNEIKMAKNLIENLTAPFEPGKYTSEYREALMNLISAKIADEDIIVPQRPEETKIIDLVEALRASVEATKEKRRPAGGKKTRKAAGS
ncbi:DNA repair protein [Clostridiales bacterium PH28_bin88]|nr:DNA repair protein [Clostridiales bacterium PH28_bin88]